METRYVPIENENENDESEIITEKIEKIEKIEKKLKNKDIIKK
jgi:hypothetical protein